MTTTPTPAETAAVEAFPDDFGTATEVDDLRAAFVQGWKAAGAQRARKAAQARWDRMTASQREAATRPARRASGRL